MEVRPLHPVFGAEVTGIDLARPLAPDALAALKEAIATYAVLLFRDQPITSDQHAAFTRSFGPIDAGLMLAASRAARLENTEVIDLANIGVDGRVLDPGSARNVSLIANQLWHSDSSFKNPPARYSVLCGVDVPATGGETEFADQRAAYDALSPELKAEIVPMVAEHWAFHSRNLLGGADFESDKMTALPPVEWPVVHTVPESGRKALYIGAHTREIRGMPTAEARMFLLDLLELATRPEFVFRHEWRRHDVLMWDNWCTLHRGRRFDLTQRRELRRCSTELVFDQVVV